MQLNVHCSTVYNSQDMKETVMPINKGMDKENAVHIYIYIVEYYSAVKRMKYCHLQQHRWA